MSNMLYACSILYKTKLPMILVFNKTDVKDAEFAKEWMTDFETFQAALRQEEEGGESSLGGGSGYMNSLLNSMSLVLEEFYRHLRVVGVSSMTGHGVDEFFEAVNEKAKEFERDYRPELQKRQQSRQQAKEGRREKELGRLLKDMNVSGSGQAAGQSRKATPSRAEAETISDLEDEDEDMPAELVDPDAEEMSDEGGEGEEGQEGLQSKYKRALREDGGGGAVSEATEHSFARYLRASSMNG